MSPATTPAIIDRFEDMIRNGRIACQQITKSFYSKQKAIQRQNEMDDYEFLLQKRSTTKRILLIVLKSSEGNEEIVYHQQQRHKAIVLL